MGCLFWECPALRLLWLPDKNHWQIKIFLAGEKKRWGILKLMHLPPFAEENFCLMTCPPDILNFFWWCFTILIN
jgi:hypothetical protein